MRNVGLVSCATVLLGAAAAQAQERHVEEVREIRQIGPGHAGGDHTIRFGWTSEAFDGKAPIKNAPYTANAVTELEQTLGDGNRIRQKTTSQLARDREGRTRRELTLSAVGPLAMGSDAHKMVFLQDPVAGTGYTLDPERKTAIKLPQPVVIESGQSGRTGQSDNDGKRKQIRIEHEGAVPFELPLPGPVVLPLPEGGPGPHLVARPLGALGMTSKKLPPPRTEDLGAQVMEGVRVQGTRSTVTIPAGELGNERPLVTVSERWVAPELGGLVVMSKHSDPRLGTTTYRLTDLRRADPDPALFQVPAGYTTRDEGPGRTLMLRRRVLQGSRTGEATGPATPTR